MTGERKRKTQLTHVDEAGMARMVDVSGKGETLRSAVAEASVRLSGQTVSLLANNQLPKGSALETARLAGIMAAKKTPELIPLCHPLMLTAIDVKAELLASGVRFVSTVMSRGRTGVEMEALTAVAVASLTLYDMVKALEKGATIQQIRLLEKTGGKSGSYQRARS